jgi:transposase InsO family protein
MIAAAIWWSGCSVAALGQIPCIFLDKIVEEMPFAIQRIQTDRGREFFDAKVQRRLLDWAIKFRPTKPRSPQLNGKVERAQFGHRRA